MTVVLIVFGVGVAAFFFGMFLGVPFCEMGPVAFFKQIWWNITHR